MKLLKGISVILLVLSGLNLHAQAEVKGLHVNNFKNIIGDSEKENTLLSFAQDNNFNYLLLYNLHYIQQNNFDFSDASKAAPLAQFIYRAKTEYGIEAVGAVGEKFASFDKIEKYNNARTDKPLEKFDVLHLEFEFWNQNAIDDSYCDYYLEDLQLSCDSTGAFTFYLETLIQTKVLAEQMGLLTETYLGTPTPAQCAQIGQHADRVMLHYYRTSDVYSNGNSIYNFKSYRLEALSQLTDHLEVIPIFASRSNFMGPWLLDHSMDQAFETYLFGQNGYEETEGDWKEVIEIVGEQWYRYTDLEHYTNLANQADTENNGNNINQRIIDNNSNTWTHEIAVYPTLAIDVIHLNCTPHTNVQLVDLAGNIVYQINDSEEINRIPCGNLTRGMYMLRFEKDSEWTFKKVVLTDL